MWDYQYVVDAEVTPAQVWACYSDPAAWPRFDRGLAEVTLQGPFEAGTRGAFLPKESDPRGPDPLPFVLVRAVKDGGFTAQTEIPGSVTMRFVHRLAELPGGGARITHGVEIDGPDADTLGPQIGPGVTEVIPGIVSALVELAAEQPA